jgi:uncharacterized protein
MRPARCKMGWNCAAGDGRGSRDGDYAAMEATVASCCLPVGLDFGYSAVSRGRMGLPYGKCRFNMVPMLRLPALFGLLIAAISVDQNLIRSTDVKAASFDCGTAKTAIEIAICRSPYVSKLDEELAKSYNNARGALSEDGRQIILRSQRDWLRHIRVVCFEFPNETPKAECLSKLYNDRIRELSSAALKSEHFILSRIDAYGELAGRRKRPSRWQASYPRIDWPNNKSTDLWNRSMVVELEQGLGHDCEGGGESENGFRVEGFSSRIISLRRYEWAYCYGTPHGHGGDKKDSFIFVNDEIKLLEPDDIFSNNSNWKEFLKEKTRADVVSYNSEAVEEILDLVIQPRVWVFNSSGLKIIIDSGDYFVCRVCHFKALLSWAELRLYLKPGIEPSG